MRKSWITSQAGHKAIGFLTDARPAWLWCADGKELIWCNPAAYLAGAKAKRHKVKRQPMMLPIKGQISRLIRLGSVGSSSLSRMQFTMGDKPVSATCICTPLRLDENDLAMLIVGVDPIEAELMERAGQDDEVMAGIFGSLSAFTLFDSEQQPIAGDIESAQERAQEEGSITLPAGPDGAQIVIYQVAGTEAEEPDAEPTDEAHIAELNGAKGNGRSTGVYQNLTALLDKLSEDENLFAPLSAEDDDFEEPASAPVQSDEDELGAANDDVEVPVYAELVEQDEEAEEPISPPDEDLEVAAFEDEIAADEAPSDLDDDEGEMDDDDVLDEQFDADNEDLSQKELVAGAYWQIVGRGFEPKEAEAAAEKADDEQTTRYNFAELSRILNDRIASERAEIREPQKRDLEADDFLEPTADRGELVNLSDESLVLNRLPLGLLIFRDQKILFANRAMTDLVGFGDSMTLRAQGLAAIFPRHEEGSENFGPVTQLSHRNGGRVPVSARLQAINWQGSPALMLTAKAQSNMPGVEGAVRAFTEQLATMEGNGYFETSRAGIISSVSGQAADMFGRTPQVLIGRPLMLLADQSEATNLRGFLEQAARTAETTRPGIALKGYNPNLRILLFAEGQAGFVTGYFGVVQRVSEAGPSGSEPLETKSPAGLDPTILARLSRSVRRPLNTIIGFSELLRSSAFGPIENQRYVEYARDIKMAGQEIVHAVDELEEFARIDSGDYDVKPIEFDLATLLHECIGKVRAPAGRARVFVRSAISENLPHIRADEPSLGQAVLNLLASAISQTPAGGHVVLSAQREDDGPVAIHVRGSSAIEGDLAERFVVFREDAPASGQATVSSVGLALTRSLLAINTCTLSIESGLGQGSLLSLFIPAELAAPAHV